MGESSESLRWTFAARVIPNIDAERARLRTTLAYRVANDLQVGIEFNPAQPDIGPIANWRAIDETKERPALIFGTSSDRIGTPHGRAFYGTFSKDLEAWTDLPIAPYAGVSFGTFDDELVGIAGLVVRWADRVSTTHLYDGHNIHQLANYTLDGGRSLGLVVAEQDNDYFLGFTFSTSFGK